MDLDRDTIKLLASDTRSDILKSLGERRKTLSELSRELGLAPATLTEQLKALEKGGLVKKMDEGRKWKYYELTRKTKKMTQPQFPVFVVIASLIVILFAGVFFMGGQMSAKQAAPAGDGVSYLGTPGIDFDGTTEASPTIYASCENGTVLVKNPTEEEVTVVLQVEEGTMERTVAAGAEMNETNVTNGTVISSAGAVSYFC